MHVVKAMANELVGHVENPWFTTVGRAGKPSLPTFLINPLRESCTLDLWPLETAVEHFVSVAEQCVQRLGQTSRQVWCERHCVCELLDSRNQPFLHLSAVSAEEMAIPIMFRVVRPGPVMARRYC